MDGILNGNISVGGVRAYAGATGRDLHIDVPLTNISIAYDPPALIAPLIYPIIPVEKETNVYYVWNKAEAMRVHNAVRARATEANRINFDVSSDGYVIKNYALAIDIPYEDLENADASLSIRESAARRVINGLNLAWEDREAVTLTTTTNMTSSTALTNAWSDPDAGTPVEDIWNGVNSKAARRIPRELWPNVRRRLDQIDAVTRLDDLKVPPGNRLHALGADLRGFHAVRVNDQYRIVFRFEGGDAFDVLCTDYH